MPDEQQQPNPWRKSKHKWDWAKIRQAYLAGRWPNFELAAEELGINPASQIRKVAAEEDWNGLKTALERKAEEQAISRLLGRLAREAEKRLMGMLDTADVLRFQGLKTMGKENLVMTATEAIRALATATDIEREIFLRRGKPITGSNGDDDPDGLGANGQGPAPTPGSPGRLQVPASISEINDAHLIRIIEQGSPATPRRLEGRVVESKDRDQPRGGSSRGAKAKGRKG